MNIQNNRLLKYLIWNQNSIFIFVFDNYFMKKYMPDS